MYVGYAICVYAYVSANMSEYVFSCVKFENVPYLLDSMTTCL